MLATRKDDKVSLGEINEEQEQDCWAIRNIPQSVINMKDLLRIEVAGRDTHHANGLSDEP